MLSRLKGIETRVIWSPHGVPSPNALDMLSRLKGIETGPIFTLYLHLWIELWICFPVWRELKHNDLSRAKDVAEDSFGYAFPFEGNWNSFSNSSRERAIKLWICFPVWRELKLEMTSASPISEFNFGYAFPFEGNWNLWTPASWVIFSVAFGYAFPFEGNWNLLEYKD